MCRCLLYIEFGAKEGGDVIIYNGVKIPRINGRPQLWARNGLDENEGIRIIYPNGKVEWMARELFINSDEESRPYSNEINYQLVRACTSSDTQLQAIKNSIIYDGFYEPVFLGYL